MRPIDLARAHGLSAQAIRNYEDAGILPAAGRTASGYRQYDLMHQAALHAFLALRRGHGHQQAVEIMRLINRGDAESAYRLIDATHAALLADRASMAQSGRTLSALSTADPVPVDGRPLSVGELAHRLDVHPATVRSWESSGILSPRRNTATGYREFTAETVRDADIARQLRRGGYPLRRVAQFIGSLREAGGPNALAAFLDGWQERLTARSRDLLAGAAGLDAYLTILARQEQLRAAEVSPEPARHAARRR